MSISIILVTKNEAKIIGRVIKELAKVIKPLPHKFEIILADYSSDNTIENAAKAAKKADLKLKIVEVDRPGRGYGMRMGVRYAKGDAYILMDADFSHDPKYIPQFIENLGNAEMVMASRFPPLGWSEEHSFFHYYGNRIVTFVINLLFKGDLTDTQNGYGIMTKKVWKKLNLKANGWTFEAEMFCKALKKSISLKEIPSFERKRPEGRAKLRLLDVSWRILLRILLERINFFN